MLAGMLKWPQATFASKIDVTSDHNEIRVDREVDGGLEHISVQIPAVITTDLRLNEPRYATLPRIMKAKRSKIEFLTLSDLKMDSKPNEIETVQVNEPPKRPRGVMVQSVSELIAKLRQDRGVL